MPGALVIPATGAKTKTPPRQDSRVKTRVSTHKNTRTKTCLAWGHQVGGDEISADMADEYFMDNTTLLAGLPLAE